MSVKRSSSAFGLSFAGGIIILFGTLVTLLFFANFHTSRMDGMMGGGMMGGGMMGGMMGGGWFFYLPLIAGIMVILGAVLMKIIPKEITIWGIVVLVFSVIGFTGMGLSFIGAIIGIIGGVIAISKGSSG